MASIFSRLVLCIWLMNVVLRLQEMKMALSFQTAKAITKGTSIASHSSVTSWPMQRSKESRCYLVNSGNNKKYGNNQQRGNSYPPSTIGSNQNIDRDHNGNARRSPVSSSSSLLLSSRCCLVRSRLQQQRTSNEEDMYGVVHRKEYEMKQVNSVHKSTTDPVRMAMSYGQESESPMKLAKALRRVYDDPYNTANPDHVRKSDKDTDRDKKLAEIGMADIGMRRGSFIVDIKRKSTITYPGENFCNFDDASRVAEAMVRLGADAVFVNTDYTAYGGDITELKSAVRAVRKVSNNRAAVVMKDIVVDEIQLGLAKEAGADGILLMSSVLGPALETFVDLATMIGLETIVECHTRNEVQRALDMMTPNILVNNYDRITKQYYPNQAIQLAGMFPGSGGPIICLATGGIVDTDTMKKHLAVGYDGVVVGKAVMGSPRAPEFIRAVRDRTLLPAELSHWGVDAEFDIDGNLMSGPKRDIVTPDDPTSYQ